MSEHVYHSQSGGTIAPRPLSGAGAREYTRPDETLAAGKLASDNLTNIELSKRLDAQQHDFMAAFAKGATFQDLTESQNKTVSMIGSMFQELELSLPSLVVHAATHGRSRETKRYAREFSRPFSRVARSYFKPGRTVVTSRWAKAYHGK